MNLSVKKIIILALAGFLILPQPILAATKTTAKKTTTAVKKVKEITQKDLLDRFLVQTQSYDRIWYTSSQTKKRYYLRNDDDLKWLISKFSVKITDKDLNKISVSAKKKSVAAILTKYKGKLITNNNKVWFVNPDDGLRYIIKDFKNLLAVTKVIGYKVSDQNLRKVAMNGDQLTFDAAFASVAYVEYDGDTFSNGYYNDTILPLASLSKVMTALVLLDQNLDWDKFVTVTKEEINYPKSIVGEDGTSEVNLQAGDQVKINDLWIAMLSASSNQAAVILADSSGISRKEFVALMNQKAKDLGLKKTEFYEMSGLDPNNISTPEEMAIMAKAAFANQKIASATNVTDYTFKVIAQTGKERNVNVKNRNYSLLAFEPQASKTGYLVEAKSNSVIKKDGKIIVVLHAANNTQRNQIISRLLSLENKLSLNR
ncbi:MAG: serine hydrolase [Candidatus Buchananbacteria bacterium]